jgi:hypothetical protein
MKQANFGLTFDSLGYLFTGNDTDPEEQMMKTVLEESNDPWLTESDPFSFTGNGGAQHRQVDDGSIFLHRRLAHSSRLQKALRERNTVLQEGRLLTISFRSVEQVCSGKCCVCFLMRILIFPFSGHPSILQSCNFVQNHFAIVILLRLCTWLLQ